MPNCATHPETEAAAYCRNCGKPLCNQCRNEWRGVTYCGDCWRAQQSSPVPPAPVVPAGAPSPGMAFFLGLIPGVGAVYNGQYGKGILHVVVLGLIISILNSNAAGGLEPLFGLMIPAWILYMALEAHQTARKRLAGEPVEEFSGMFGSAMESKAPIGAIALIVLGTVFLLNTLGYLSFQRVARFWPVLLIAAGIYLLVARFTGRQAAGAATNPGDEAQQPPA